MAHTITGIDLGSWSVKFAVFDVGFRRVRIDTSFEEPVPPGEAPLAERQAEALRAGVARLPSESTIHMALPGEMLALRVLDLPFSDARKVEQVVGYELEGQIMHDLSEVVMDHVILSASRHGRGRSRWLACPGGRRTHRGGCRLSRVAQAMRGGTAHPLRHPGHLSRPAGRGARSSRAAPAGLPPVHRRRPSPQPALFPARR